MVKISKIDKDFEDIIYKLDANGFKPYASCDGVEANHKNPKEVSLAYISFLKSPKILGLMADFLKDKDNFFVSIISETETEPYQLYGNLISGTTYGVYFSNKKGDKTQYFKDIINRSIESEVIKPSNEYKKLYVLDKVLEESSKSSLTFHVGLNTNCQPFMKNDGKINMLSITTKYGNTVQRGKIVVERAKNMEMLAKLLSRCSGLKCIRDCHSASYGEECITYTGDRGTCTIYFKDEHFFKIVELIQYIGRIEPKIPTIEIEEVFMDFKSLYANNGSGASLEDR